MLGGFFLEFFHKKSETFAADVIRTLVLLSL